MGSTASNIGRGLAGAVTLGGSELFHGNNAFGGGPLGRGLSAGITGGLSEFTQRNPFGVPIDSPLASVFGNGKPSSNPYVAGPFSLDPNQVSADQASITGLGKKQYADTLAGIDTQGKAAQDYASQTFQKMLPDLAEDYNAHHLLNSTGYQQEAARQASYLANDVAHQQSQARLAALTGRQGFEQSSLGRGLSLEDFINQANVAKTIGAQAAPQVGNGKGQTGTLLSGIGSVAAPAAKLAAK